MTHLELQSLRRLLFFSVPEAALLVAASPERLTGVQERTWRRWEDGSVPVPENIAQAIMALAGWRSRAVAAMRESVNQMAQAHGDEASLNVVWYDTLDDWASLAGREPVLWRPHCSVVAEAVAAGARLVEFDSAAYAMWLGKRSDSEPMRGAWASTVG